MNPLNIASAPIEAQFSTDLPGTVGATAPDDIQWAPPGKHSICASRAGKPVEIDITVDEAGAQRVAASFAEHMAAANRNEEDLVYGDFNHSDEEASFHPQSFYWGGTDPQRGGIRAKVVWTSLGRAAVIGKTYRRFSPCFYPDAQGNITGLPVNCGGLVNRAAFKRIAPIMSKAAEAEVVSGGQSFMEKAAVVARARNLRLDQAIDVLAHERPELYEEYHAQLMGRSIAPVRATSARSEFVDEFLIQGRGLAEALGIGEAAAFSKLAAAQPALYERYRAKLLGVDVKPEHMMACHARADHSPFFVRSKLIAEQKNIHITEAFRLVAAQEPQLYDAYMASL